ncbi:MAG: SDR family oxidoreductase [Candidatus Aminicenantes bacterium]|jgi:acyl transferase domain-containing protein/acyl carrier protein
MNDQKQLQTGLEIAVIGTAGRFPGAKNIHEFWNNLINGVESITFFTDEELAAVGAAPGILENPNYIKANGILEGIEYFDALFFGYTPKEAQVMDPQIRIFHEVSWTALEDAGYDSLTHDGLIGLYAGATPNFDWEARSLLSGKSFEVGDFAATQLTKKDYLSLRIAYKLNLTGPSFVIHSTCSTSLLSIHLACQAILNGECDMALAGGVTVSVLVKGGYIYHEGGITSVDGHCRAFDAAAKGMIGGDGAAVVVLKRLEEALAHRDHIYAVVKGSAINNDGIRRAGFTAPSVEGQAEVIKMALQVAEVKSETIGYIETHGTATQLGDPVEIEGLKLAFNTNKKAFCGIGSVKTNMGHLDAASGVTGFIKAVLALNHKMIPPSLHFEIPNPKIDFIHSPFFVNAKLTEWEPDQHPRRAGVSSFGIGGTNAHVILEEAPEGTKGLAPLCIEEGAGQGRDGVSLPSSSQEYQLIILSAKTETALRQMKQNLAEYFRKNLLNPGNHENQIYSSPTLADTAYTLQIGRSAFQHRWMTACSSVEEAIAMLTSTGAGEMHRILPEEECFDIEKTEPAADRDSLLQIGRLWLHGHHLDWEGLYSLRRRCRVSLPTYPFEGQRYWIEADAVELQKGLQPPSPLSNPQDVSNRFYVPSWKRLLPKPRKTKSPVNICPWLVFVNELSISTRLVKQLQAMGQDIVMVKMADQFSQVEDGVYTVNPRESNHYQALFAKLWESNALPGKIIHLWNLTTESDCILTGEYFDEAQYMGFYSLLYVAKAIGKKGIGHDVQIILLSNHLADVLGEEPLCPGKAPVLGLLKVIPQELPGISCSHIDIHLPEAGTSKEAALIDCLLEDFSNPLGEPAIAYRNNRPWVQVFEPVPLESDPEDFPQLKDQGVYLVTGGLGRMGLLFSQLLGRKGGVRLVLTGRSDFPPREEWDQWLIQHQGAHPVTIKIKKLQELEKMGARVLYFKADTADKEQMQKVVAYTEETLGAINGVIHAAGITGGTSFRPLQDLTRQDCQRLFQAKVYGLMVLEELFKEKALDFFWVMSSLSCILGGLNLSAFSAANLFADLLVKSHNQSTNHGPGWLSLNWENMEPNLSTTAFKQIFSLENVDQIVASVDGNLQTRIDKWINPKWVKDKDNQSGDRREANAYPRPELSVPYAAPAHPAEETLTSIWKELLGFDKIGVYDDFFELGGDSLKVITVVSKIQKKIEVLIPIPTFFDHPTIKELAQYIGEESGKEILVPIESAEKKEYYGLTSAQKRLYVIHQVDEKNTSYNMFNTIMLEGENFGRQLESTFRHLMHRHEGLRTFFDVIHNEPVQRVRDQVDFSIDFYDLTKGLNQTTDESQSQIPMENQVLQTIKQCIRPFDLCQTPLLRVGLIKTKESVYILVTDMHHIVSDGYSVGILTKEFMALYEGKELLPLRLRYTDYSEWLRSGNLKQSLKQQEQYWINEFSGNIPELRMPTDYERPAVQSFEGDVMDLFLDEKESEGLQEIASVSNATLFMVLVALYNVFLAKLSDQEDIVVGVGVAGRRYEELQKIIGIFVNTLAVRNYPSKKKNFKEFLTEVKEKTLMAYENQDYQFEELVEKVLPHREKNRNPLFDVVIVSQDIAVNAVDIPQTDSRTLNAKPYGHKNEVSKFDMTLICKKIADKLWFIFEYRTKLFKQETIQRFITYFKEIVSQIIEDPDVRLKDITISHRLLQAKSDHPEMDLGF